MSKEKDKISRIKTLIQERIDILEDEHRDLMYGGTYDHAYSEVLLGKIESFQEMYNEIEIIENE
tara:strand:+ start:2802 stop:2993 length:192 start_codon:yes stop_codon:yes gene_type:complete